MGRTADAIAEGVIIATAAARLSIRNRILVDAIRNDSAFSVEAVKPFARQTLEALAATEVELQAKKPSGKSAPSPFFVERGTETEAEEPQGSPTATHPHFRRTPQS